MISKTRLPATADPALPKHTSQSGLFAPPVVAVLLLASWSPSRMRLRLKSAGGEEEGTEAMCALDWAGSSGVHACMQHMHVCATLPAWA